MTGKIFINYRRGDDPGNTGRLFDRLEGAFSADQLFMDVDSIPPGRDFVRVLEEQVAQCDVLLAVIGKAWLDARDDHGGRRLDGPDDFVRIEIESALKQDKLIIPVLVQDARMPRAEELPEAIRQLARRNAVRLTHERFKSDTQGLIKDIRQALREVSAVRRAQEDAARKARMEEKRRLRSPTRRRLVLGLGGAAGLAATGGGIIWTLRSPLPEPGPRLSSPLVLIRTIDVGSEFNSVAFSPDGRTALWGGRDKTLQLLDLEKAERLRTFTGHSDVITSLAFSPDGLTALSGSRDTTFKLWEVATGTVIRAFEDSGWVSSVALSPDGLTVLSGSGAGTLRLWDVATGKELRTFEGYRPAIVRSIAFWPDGHTVLTGSDSVVALWEVANGTVLRTFTGHSGDVNSVALSPDRSAVLSGSSDTTLRLWDATTAKHLRTFTGHSAAVRSVTFSPDGRAALSGGEDKALKLWEVVTGNELTFSEIGWRTEGHSQHITSVAFSLDGRMALSAGADATLRVWGVRGL
jgi:hypothetical protein